jgi:hypothetical protein
MGWPSSLQTIVFGPTQARHPRPRSQTAPPDFAGRMRPLPIDRPPESLPPCDWLDEAKAPAEPAALTGFTANTASVTVATTLARHAVRRRKLGWAPTKVGSSLLDHFFMRLSCQKGAGKGSDRCRLT